MLLAGNAFNYFSKCAKIPAVRTSAGILIIIFGVYSGYSGLMRGHHDHQHHTDLSSTLLELPDSVDLMRIPAISRNTS